MSSLKDVYNRNATIYDQQRSKDLFEKSWLDKFLAKLSPHDDILDVGCGSAEPIASYLIHNKMQITGIDFSQSMLGLAQARFPKQHWHLQDMRELNLNQKFKGIIAWNSFFHLSQVEQRKVLIDFANLLEEGGVLLFTAGAEAGEAWGKVNGEDVYHSSLELKEYKEILGQNGVEVIEFRLNDSNCNFHSVFLAQKIG